jgi:hypothetical protein
MDTLRGLFGGSRQDDDQDDYPGEDDTGVESPPLGIGTDERRMQVRAYNFWASLLQDRNLPSIEDLELGALPDFGPHSVLLDFSNGIENPAVQYLGAELAQECGTDNAIGRLSDVPARSLLSRITDHYLQIIANQAPIGFEAEFVNQRGATILYRGILLPFSSDDDTIDFIFGVINWKEMADQLTTDELLLEIDQALEDAGTGDAPLHPAHPVTDWADGPGAEIADLPVSGFAAADYDDDFAGDAEDDCSSDPLPQPLFGMDVEALLEDEDDDDAGEDDVAQSRFASLLGASPKPSGGYSPDDDDDWGDEPVSAGDAAEVYDRDVESHSDDTADDVSGSALEVEISADFAAVESIVHAAEADADTALGLYDCLAAARELAQAARSSEDRSRAALYDAVSRAYDVSLAALDEPEDFAELVSDNGLTVQERAPMTPVVKLVFGADYDKTRLTEYAAVLSYAHRTGIARGQLADQLRRADGGLKGLVMAERRLRREEAGKAVAPLNRPGEALAAKLRAMEPRGFGDIAQEGQEFALVMIRRLETGEIVILGEVPDDVALVERAARRLLG